MTVAITVQTTMKVMVEVCPFCQGIDLTLRGGSGNPYFVGCNTCQASGPRDVDGMNAATLWNGGTQQIQKQVSAALATQAAMVGAKAVL
jgi:hypothetical protein